MSELNCVMATDESVKLHQNDVSLMSKKSNFILFLALCCPFLLHSFEVCQCTNITNF